jgi:hypothetical protein
MRDSSGKAHTLKSGEIGYWHKIGDKPSDWRPPPKPVETPQIDAEALMEDWLDRTKPEWIYNLAGDLGVKPHSLLELHVAWAGKHNAFAWPMRDVNGRACGIRLRAKDGKKWSVPGSKSGVFLPYCAPHTTAWICEGGTDAAAILSLNLFPIGRPSCSGGTDEINATIKRMRIAQAVIISDNDADKVMSTGQVFNPGADGAKRLSERLCAPNCVITLPCKDAREFLSMGGTAQMLENLTRDQLWQKNSCA